jgi:hypothetical protein
MVATKLVAVNLRPPRVSVAFLHWETGRFWARVRELPMRQSVDANLPQELPDRAKVFAKKARAKRIVLLRLALPEKPPRPFHLCSDRALGLGKRDTTPGNFDLRVAAAI